MSFPGHRRRRDHRCPPARSALVYDAFLDGTHDVAVNRSVAARIMQVVPEMAGPARADRAFRTGVAGWAVANGVRQFIDLGPGIPAEATGTR